MTVLEGGPLSLDQLLRTVPFCSGKLGEVTVGSSLEPWRINACADLGDKKKLWAHVWFMSPSSVGPGGLFPLLSFYWQGGGLLQERSVLSVTERLGCDKGTGLGVGQSTQISPSVGHKQWLNGGWWCDSLVLRILEQISAKGPDIMSTPPAWERVCSRVGWESELKGTWQLHFLTSFFSPYFTFSTISKYWMCLRAGRKELDGSDGVEDGVCGSKLTQFQFQHISPNYILWSLVRDYSCLILTNAAEWDTSLTTEHLHGMRWPWWLV